MVQICALLKACPAGCLGTSRNGAVWCKNFWWTPLNDLTEEAQPYASSLRKYDLAYRVTFVSFLVSQVAGFVLLAIACQAPPPFHQLTGVYVCVGALFVCPVALCIINDRKDSFLKSVNLKEPTHLAVDSSSEEED